MVNELYTIYPNHRKKHGSEDMHEDGTHPDCRPRWCGSRTRRKVGFIWRFLQTLHLATTLTKEISFLKASSWFLYVSEPCRICPGGWWWSKSLPTDLIVIFSSLICPPHTHSMFECSTFDDFNHNVITINYNFNESCHFLDPC